VPQVPPERPQPHEVPFREVEHTEPDDPDAWPWETGRYSVGHVRGEEFWGWRSKAEEAAFWKERKRVEAARRRLGGFGFRS
jgi:FAD/FMN-containing dehydrogenase